MPGLFGFGLSLSRIRLLYWIFFVFSHLCTAAACVVSDLDFVNLGHSHINPLDFGGDPLQPVLRWGEALHPGPSSDCHLFGFSNPSGLRQKEAMAIALGAGVWSFSESQLSWQTQKTCAALLRQQARTQNRLLRVHMGAPVATRTTSTWAGTWSGVSTISDFPSQELSLPYINERDCGRMLTTRHMIGQTAVTNMVIYGFPKGPTWPNAWQLTEELLQIATTEIILGGTGPRLIGGDFNMDAWGIPLFNYWRQLGWISAQELAERLWGQEPQFTCKHATERDIVWLSPEAAALCQMVDVADVFAEHSTITVGLRIPTSNPRMLSWPKPSEIPWTEVEAQWSSTAVPPDWTLHADVNQQWAEWAASFEDSLQGHFPTAHGRGLQGHQKGRLQQTQPIRRRTSAPVLKPSRPSEVVLRNDLIGSEVRHWFRQLRRLQSYVAAVRADKQTPAALAYRLELWAAVLRSPGFHQGFSVWWRHHRAHSLPDAPSCFPPSPPGLEVAEAVFAVFKLNFEKYEAWHLRQRGKLLLKKYEKGMQGIFQDLNPPNRDRLDLLHQKTSFSVLAVDVDSGQLHLDAPVASKGFSKWMAGDVTFQPDIINDVVIQVPDASLFEQGDLVEQFCTLADTNSLHAELLDYWTPTWKAMSTVDSHTWQRVTAFFQAYVPKFHMDPGPIQPEQWYRALKRYKPSAARGVDGISHRDLLSLPLAWTERLLAMLHDIELGRTSWPTAILYGVVNVLAKNEGASTVDRFRPVVIFSVIYRTWARVRSKQLLRWLTPKMDVEAFGFMPGCEPSQLWLVLQAEIERTLQAHGDLCGLSTDLTRAFNFIPRQHSFSLAEHLGVPERITVPWRLFLDHCTRAFDVRGHLSSCTTSSCGLPEGDAMSVFGMVQLSFAWHLYMRAYSPSIRALSFVDNLSLLASVPGLLATGLACVIEFFRLWNMAIDVSKSYCWALNSGQRKQLTILPFQKVESAMELGGALSFTRKRFTGLQQKRISKLQGKWRRLKNSQAPLRQKLAAVPMVFWSAALHGITGSCMGENHLDKLRSQALKALRLSHAGVNGLLRLTLSSTPTADPSWWRLQHTVSSFARWLRKEPRLLNEWKSFMWNFDGFLFSGPFSQLLVVLGQIGWRVRTPLFD